MGSLKHVSAGSSGVEKLSGAVDAWPRNREHSYDTGDTPTPNDVTNWSSSNDHQQQGLHIHQVNEVGVENETIQFVFEGTQNTYGRDHADTYSDLDDVYSEFDESEYGSDSDFDGSRPRNHSGRHHRYCSRKGSVETKGSEIPPTLLNQQIYRDSVSTSDESGSYRTHDSTTHTLSLQGTMRKDSYHIPNDVESLTNNRHNTGIKYHANGHLPIHDFAEKSGTDQQGVETTTQHHETASSEVAIPIVKLKEQGALPFPPVEVMDSVMEQDSPPMCSWNPPQDLFTALLKEQSNPAPTVNPVDILGNPIRDTEKNSECKAPNKLSKVRRIPNGLMGLKPNTNTNNTNTRTTIDSSNRPVSLLSKILADSNLNETNPVSRPITEYALRHCKGDTLKPLQERTPVRSEKLTQISSPEGTPGGTPQASPGWGWFVPVSLTASSMISSVKASFYESFLGRDDSKLVEAVPSSTVLIPDPSDKHLSDSSVAQGDTEDDDLIFKFDEEE